MFLDDERDPPSDGYQWCIVRSVADAKAMVINYGFPLFVSFDNDLGQQSEEGRCFARWLIEWDLDHHDMPVNFSWFAHTQNPIARDAIDELLKSYVNHKN